MTQSAIPHVDQVHSCIHISEHLPPEKIYNYLPGWSRLYVKLAHGRARVDDYDGQSPPGPFFGLSLGKELTALVMAYHIANRERGIFAGGLAVRVEAETSDGACINDTLCALVEGGLQDVVCAFDIARIHFIGVFAPQAIISRAVIDDPARFCR